MPQCHEQGRPLSAGAISLCALVLLILGVAAGEGLGAVLPEHHLSKDSREIVHLCIGVIATLAALVLGLLIGSAKEAFDTQVRETQQVATQVVQLDQALRQHGDAAAAARAPLLAAANAILAHAVGRGEGLPSAEARLAARQALQALQRTLLALAPLALASALPKTDKISE